MRYSYIHAKNTDREISKARALCARVREDPRIGALNVMSGHLLNATVSMLRLPPEKRDPFRLEIDKIQAEVPALERAAHLVCARRKLVDLREYALREEGTLRRGLVCSARGLLRYHLTKAEATLEDLGVTVAEAQELLGGGDSS